MATDNPEGHFPTYVPSEERMEEIAKKYAESNTPLVDRYDSTRENRAKGAGFYQFSADEETRQAQMDALKAAREETEKTRQETGAVDIRPGEMEGIMREGGGGGEAKGKGASRAMEKRKRELEERRKLVEAKRRKVAEKRAEAEAQGASAGPSAPQPPPPQMDYTDPFAVLEASRTVNTTKSQTKTQHANAADDFLASLEQEFLGTTKRG